MYGDSELSEFHHSVEFLEQLNNSQHFHLVEFNCGLTGKVFVHVVKLVAIV